MTLIRIAPTTPSDMPDLFRLALRYIYEEKKMSLAEIAQMQFSVNWWCETIVREKEKKAEKFLILPGDEINDPAPIEEMLQYIGKLLYMKETNTLSKRLKNRIMMVKCGLLDWRKFHRLEEAYTPEGLEKAQAMYQKYKEKNKEQEDDGTGA